MSDWTLSTTVFVKEASLLTASLSSEETDDAEEEGLRGGEGAPTLVGEGCGERRLRGESGEVGDEGKWGKEELRLKAPEAEAEAEEESKPVSIVSRLDDAENEEDEDASVLSCFDVLADAS